MWCLAGWFAPLITHAHTHARARARVRVVWGFMFGSIVGFTATRLVTCRCVQQQQQQQHDDDADDGGDDDDDDGGGGGDDDGINSPVLSSD